MTFQKPTIIVNRLVAKKSGKTTYDEVFHEGLNVLSGCNGGGKTSVIQLLVYGLGYEVNNWKEQAKQCDTIYVGLRINEEPITLKRNNESVDKHPMDICFKPLDDALKSSAEEWSNYPYSINSARESFSQKIFSLMGIPEAKSNSNNDNITIHQILRLIYSDQSNTSASIFNVEPFDSAFKRESVGNYLLGLDDSELINAKIKLVSEEKRLDKALAKLSAVHSVIGKTSYAKDLGTIGKAKKSYFDKITKLNTEIQDKKQVVSLEYKKEKDITENYAANSIKVKGKLLECEESIQALNYEIEDSKLFIKELDNKSKSIRDSIRVGNYLPKIEFKICPSCFEKIKNLNELPRSKLRGIKTILTVPHEYVYTHFLCLAL